MDKFNEDTHEFIPSRRERFQLHWRKYRWTYLIGGSMLMAGVTAGVLVGRRGNFLVQNPALVNIKPVANSIQVSMVRPGNAAYVLQCVETQEVFPSMRQAASALGLNASDISKHLKGELSDVRGMSFVKLAEV